jgi:hypothetical protein
MAAKLTILTHKIAIQLYLVAESYTICSFRSRRPVPKLLDTPSYTYLVVSVSHNAIILFLQQLYTVCVTVSPLLHKLSCSFCNQELLSVEAMD